MTLTRKSLELLIDLVEIKLGALEVTDRDDRKAQRELERCLNELSVVTGRARRAAPAAAEEAA